MRSPIGWGCVVVFSLLIMLWGFQDFIDGTQTGSRLFRLVDFTTTLLVWLGITLRLVLGQISMDNEKE